MRRPALTVFALTLVATAACGTDNDQTWTDSDADTVAVAPTPEMRAQFTAMRSEVDSVMGHLRREVETRQQAATGDTLEAWTDTYAKVADRRGDLLVRLDDLDRASVNDARSIRSDVASDLADLEADVVRQKLRLGWDDQASSADVEEHLVRLEQNLDTIEARSRAIHAGATAQRQPGEQRQYDDASRHIPSTDDIRSLREDIHEARRDAAELRMVTIDDRRDRMDNVSNQIADLTRDVRTHWYNAKYSFMGTGMRR